MTDSSIENNSIITGTIWKQILLFFFPILLGTFFQQLYNTVDAIIVGQFVGKEALAAVGGGTGTAINFLIGFFTGLSSGATVIISHYYGAQNREKVSKAIHNAAAIALWAGVIISVLGYFFAEPVLKLIGTPDAIIGLAKDYMHIYFSGSIFVVIYNMGSGIFRAFGDSRSPFLFLVIGCFTNIVLDLLFIAVLGWGVKGAAFATIISQFIACILVVAKLRSKTDSCKLYYSKIRIEKPMLVRTFAIGLPAGIQSIMYSVSNLMIQSSINSFGTDAAAAWAAFGKIDCLIWMILNAFSIALTTFVGQNYGAGKISRAKKGVKDCIAMSFGTIFVLGIVYSTVGKYGFYLFTDDKNVIEFGTRMIMVICPMYFTFVFEEILSGAMRGAGKTLLPTIMTVAGICGLRAIWIGIVPNIIHTVEAVTLCYPVTWIVTSTMFILYYRFGDIFSEKKGN